MVLGLTELLNYEDCFDAFQSNFSQLLFELNSICILSKRSISITYLVGGLLFPVISSRFLEWQRIFAAAPIAFEEDGKWNNSVLIPLLLVEARDQLWQVHSKTSALT